jgi:hypothetical protein
MSKVGYTAFFQGPLAVYPSPTAQSDPVTGGIYLGTDFLEGNYADVSNADAQQWNAAYGTALKGGRYRICRLATNAILANLPATAGKGEPVGWAAGTYVQSAVIANAGSGATTDGTYNCVSTYNIGSQMPAIAQVVISGGLILSASIIQGGGPFLGVPTFGLTEIAGLAGGASILAQLFQSSSYISSLDSTSNLIVRGIMYAVPTQAQITAGSWVVVQESGIAQVYVTTATQTAKGVQATAASGGAVTTNTAAAAGGLLIGYTLALAAAATTVPVVLALPTIED